jgi:hypothetical protein
VLGGPAGAAVHGTVPSGPQPGALAQMKDTARAFTNVTGLLDFGSGFAPGISDPGMHLKTGARREIADEFEGVPGGGVIRAVSKVANVLDKLTSFTSQPDHFRMNLRYCQPLER